MSMSTHVNGIIPADAKCKKMLSIYQQCEELGVDIPAKVEKFFNGEPPDEKVVVVDIPSYEWSDGDMSSGIEVNVADIPKDVKIIRFVNSW